MNQSKRLLHARKLALIASVTAISLMMAARYFYAYGQDKSGFPDGFDAVQAPNSHKVIFEMNLYACSKLLCQRRARRNRCTTTDGRVSFLTGIPEAGRRITAPTEALGTALARKSQLIPALGVRIG